MNKPRTVDDYIALYPEAVREVLHKIRKTIKESAPQAEEAISYGIPTFKLNGNLVHFGAFKAHIGFYPSPKAIEYFKQELSQYKQAKGSVQFPFDDVPFSLIKKIVAYRVKQNGA